MKLRVLLILLTLALSAFADDRVAVTVTNPGATINSLTGEYGLRYFSTLPVKQVITALGRWKSAGNNQIHTLKLYDSAGNLLRSVDVNMAGQPNNAFVYGAITPYELPPIGNVYLLSTQSSGAEIMSGPSGQIVSVADTGRFNVAWKTGSTFSDTPNGNCSYGPLSFLFSEPVQSWTYHAGTNRYNNVTDAYQVRGALADAGANHPTATVKLPGGAQDNWGAGGYQFFVPDGVTLEGADDGSTVINMSTSAPTGYSTSLILLGQGSKLRKITFNGPNAANCIPVSTYWNDWRVSEITYNQYSGRNSYFMGIWGSTRGLVDQFTFSNDGVVSPELFFVRGPTDAWDVANTFGTADNIFIESSTFYGSSYICDANSSARVVVRKNNVPGNSKVDGHGVHSNQSTPPRGVRHMEVYDNTFAPSGAGSTAMELRGGGGRIFNNTSTASAAQGTNAWFVTEYSVFQNNGTMAPNYQTPADWPIRDQIGRGRYAVAGDWTTATSEPMYLWGNTKGGSPWAWSFKTIPAAAQTRFALQGGTPPFGWQSIIQADRDYFEQVADFNGTTGIGIGTLLQMNAINMAGAKVGVGYWVTNAGEWDSTHDGYDGQLYVWSGSAWVLNYTPYPFPHPMRAGDTGGGDTTAPTLLSATINNAGTQLALKYSEPVTWGAGGNGGGTVSLTGGPASLTYGAGNGSDTLTFNTSRFVDSNELGGYNFNPPGNGIEDMAGNDLAAISSAVITNNSTRNDTAPARTRLRRGTFGLGF